LQFSKLGGRLQTVTSQDRRFNLTSNGHFFYFYDVKERYQKRCISYASWKYANDSDTKFDAKGNLVSYSDEAADTWLFCLATGKPEPVEMAEMVEEGYSAY
jgi:hypothetical protein